MPVNNMSVGRDYTLIFYDRNTGTTVSFGDVQDFSITAGKHNLKSMPYNDDPRFGYIDDGFSMSFSIVRTTSALEDYQLAQQERFRNGQHVLPGFLNETIRNPDGSVSRYVYVDFVFYLTDLGNVSRDKNVMQKAEGMASYKRLLA